MGMNPSRIFILRPIATSLLMCALLIGGLIAYQLLPVSSLPQVDYPTIQVVTFYPGADPTVMTSSVTAPLEKQLGQLSGLTQMTSESSMGASIITLQFALLLPLDVAEQEVQSAINNATTYLPKDLPNPPVYNKVNPADAPILTLAATSKNHTLIQVEDEMDTRFVQKIAQIPGVGYVSLNGGQRPAIRIQVNPTALAAYKISLDELRLILKSASVNGAKGNFDGPRLGYTISANDQLLTSEAYRQLFIAYRNGAAIRLTDVAEVEDGAENAYQAAWMNKTPAIIVSVQRQPGANVIEVVERIKKLLPKLESGLSSGIHLEILSDRTETIRASIRDVKRELVFSVLLVITVIYLFLLNARATLIPSLAVPLSLIGTFSAMYFLGYSLNNLTLMALTVSAGFVVDDAIVMIENIMRHIEQGDRPLEAALKGAKQIGFTIISLTLSLIAVLIPLLFMQDMIGRLFREFAMTVTVTVLISAFISLTLTPMLCARLLNKKNDESHTKFELMLKKKFEALVLAYKLSLEKVLMHQSFVLWIILASMLLTLVLFLNLSKGLFPLQDTGLIQGISNASQSISFEAMKDKQLKLLDKILKNPAVDSVASFIGIDAANHTLNTGRFYISLKPKEQRKEKITQLMDNLEYEANQIAGVTLYLQAMQELSIEDRVSPSPYQISINGPNQNEVDKVSDEILTLMRKDSTFSHPSNDKQNKGLVTELYYDRDSAMRFGVSVQAIDDLVYDAFGQRQIATYFTQRNQYRVILESLQPMRAYPQSLDTLYLKSVSGGMVPLKNLISIKPSMASINIMRQGQFPVSLISFDIQKGESLSDALKKMSKILKKVQMPPTVILSYEGAVKLFNEALNNELGLMIAAIVVVYIVLGVLYESVIHPVTILSTLPSACIGGCLALLLTGEMLSVVALIGMVLLIGLVMKNAIMMIDFALEQERLHLRTPKEAIFEACLLRFRPILMTTMASLLGAFPLALSQGMGSELRRPLGWVIIGGLLLSQVMTLYTTPVIYLTFDRLFKRVVNLKKKG